MLIGRIADAKGNGGASARCRPWTGPGGQTSHPG